MTDKTTRMIYEYCGDPDLSRRDELNGWLRTLAAIRQAAQTWPTRYWTP